MPSAAAGKGADPEVSDKARRRRFTGEYKRGIVREVDGCTERGEAGAVLRREGLYSSHVTAWRAQFESGGAAALAPHKRGRKPVEVGRAEARVAELEQDVRRLQERLQRAELIIDVQKKVSQMLGVLETADDDRRHS